MHTVQSYGHTPGMPDQTTVARPHFPSIIRKGGAPLRGGEPSHVSHNLCRSGARLTAGGWVFAISASTSPGCSIRQRCSTVYVAETTPFACRSPVAVPHARSHGVATRDDLPAGGSCERGQLHPHASGRSPLLLPVRRRAHSVLYFRRVLIRRRRAMCACTLEDGAMLREDLANGFCRDVGQAGRASRIPHQQQ